MIRVKQRPDRQAQIPAGIPPLCPQATPPRSRPAFCVRRHLPKRRAARGLRRCGSEPPRVARRARPTTSTSTSVVETSPSACARTTARPQGRGDAVLAARLRTTAPHEPTCDDVRSSGPMDSVTAILEAAGTPHARLHGDAYPSLPQGLARPISCRIPSPPTAGARRHAAASRRQAGAGPTRATRSP